LAGVFSGRLN